MTKNFRLSKNDVLHVFFQDFWSVVRKCDVVAHTQKITYSRLSCFFLELFYKFFFFSNIERYSTLFVLKCQKTGLKLLDYQELFSRCTRNQLKEFLICISICTVRLYEFHLLRVVVQALHIKLAVEYNDVIVIAISMC